MGSGRVFFRSQIMSQSYARPTDLLPLPVHFDATSKRFANSCNFVQGTVNALKLRLLRGFEPTAIPKPQKLVHPKLVNRYTLQNHPRQNLPLSRAHWRVEGWAILDLHKLWKSLMQHLSRMPRW